MTNKRTLKVFRSRIMSFKVYTSPSFIIDPSATPALGDGYQWQQVRLGFTSAGSTFTLKASA